LALSCQLPASSLRDQGWEGVVGVEIWAGGVVAGEGVVGSGWRGELVSGVWVESEGVAVVSSSPIAKTGVPLGSFMRPPAR